MWISVLHEHGIDVRLTDAGRLVTLEKGGACLSLPLRRLRRTPRPSELRQRDRGELLWIPGSTAAVRKRLAQIGASWVSDSGEVHVPAPWGVEIGEPDATPGDREAGAAAEMVTLSPGGLTVLQFLLEHPTPAVQTRIATAVGLSQPRVSQVLKELAGLIRRTGAGWQVTRPRHAFDTWLAAPRAGAEVTTGWYSVAPAAEQIAAFRERAEADRADVRLCGDWAADLLAPWRPPRLITLHADRTPDLEAAGFVPAPAASATLILHIGQIRGEWRPDPAVLAAMAARRSRAGVAPVTEIAREILATGGADADQAVAELRDVWLRSRSAAMDGLEEE